MTNWGPEFVEWTPIAYQLRGIRRGGAGQWRTLEDAPISYDEARRLYDRGELLMANRVADDRTFVVVLTPAKLRKTGSSGLRLRAKAA